MGLDRREHSARPYAAPARTQGPDGVLLTDAPSNANLAVVRSLGRRGIPVDVCGFEGEFNLSYHSRYVRERITLPSPTRDAGGFIDGLRRVLSAGRHGILCPTTERTIQLIAEHRQVFPPTVAIPIPDSDAIRTVLDKERTIALATKVDVPAPQTWCPADADALRVLASEVSYPVIVKPRQTNFLGSDGVLRSADRFVATSASRLIEAYERVAAVAPRPLVQQLVPGVGVGISSIWDRGVPLAFFAHRRLREEDPRGGRASAAVSIPCDARLINYASRLLGAIRWHGVAMVEFKWDQERDVFWLLEINGRFWGSLALALVAGMDFPYYLYQLARGEAILVPDAYTVGAVARDPVAELKHFIRTMLLSRRLSNGRMPSRLDTLRQAPAILHPSRVSYNWTLDDPEPGRREWLHTLASLIRKRP